MADQYTKHYSVMYDDCLKAFSEASSKKTKCVFADMTFGAGGHSLGIAQEIPNSTVYSVDQDPDAMKNGLEKIKELKLESNVILNKMNYEEFPLWVSENHPELKFDGILMDLGVSSHHFDKFDRGFSFREDAPLDMRMDNANDELLTAADILNDFPEEDIANIIFKYGEDRLSRRIAAKIIEVRSEKRIESTKQLEEIVFHSYPKSQRHKKTHPATRTFQALRIYVNRELDVLENTLEKLFSMLADDGILQVISFHSLEDRIAKHKFKEIFQTHKNTAKILTKKPIYPSEKEVGENPRSRSAKLRIIQKLDENAQGGVSGKKNKKKEKYTS